MFERILSIILPVLVIIVIGWLYARHSRPDMRATNKLNMDVCVPLLVFSALAAKDFHLAAQWKLMPAAVLIVVVSGLLCWPIARLTGISLRTLLPPVMFNNCGNMGLPLALLAFGREGFNAFVVLFVISNLLHFTLGAFIFSSRTSLRSLGKNPIVLATALGLLFGLAGWQLPDWLMRGLKMLGEITIPLMLFALGVRMVDVSFKGWHIGLLGAVLCPLTGLLAAATAIPLLQLDTNQAALVMLFGSLPPAVLNFLMAELYQQEADRMASIVLLGNLLSLLFVPLGLAFAL
ncbi:AEC family transporter [Vogesella oryzae]|uniref:AEC family transporter n=1 Tax=Vogesella oryzae TaxID=1735285 RepID=UPI00158434A7|nr:AEC family transporter [Vogesella oryzae]